MDEQTLDLVEEEIKRAEALLARDIDDIKAEGAALGIAGAGKAKGSGSGTRRAAGKSRLSTNRRKEVIAQLRATQGRDAGVTGARASAATAAAVAAAGAGAVADGGLIDRILEEHGLQGIEKQAVPQPAAFLGGDNSSETTGSVAALGATGSSVLSAAAASRGGIVGTSAKGAAFTRTKKEAKAKTT